jgi:dTDP-4-amino-4,6-dideoxygalactose transaminase
LQELGVKGYIDSREADIEEEKIMKEYGSDFVIEEPKGKLNKIYSQENIEEFLLGRTALDAIIQDAITEYNVRTVMLPSYCCHTMIAPFQRYGLQIKFYDVIPAKTTGIEYCLNYDEKFDIILIMQYFGFYNAEYFDMIDRLKLSGRIVIEDATHSVLQQYAYSKRSDYVFVSYRKWMASNGGAVVIKRSGKLQNVQNRDSVAARSEYLKLKGQAFAEKKKYMQKGAEGEKVYLPLFRRAEDIVENEYAGFDIDMESSHIIRYTDYESIKEIRCRNASYLAQNLTDIPKIHLLCNTVCDGDAPLFVPVLMKNNDRQAMRQYLINNNIFLPQHWPLSDMHNISDRGMQLYNEEISIICDQRYNLADMEHIVSKIKEWAE